MNEKRVVVTTLAELLVFLDRLTFPVPAAGTWFPPSIGCARWPA